MKIHHVLCSTLLSQLLLLTMPSFASAGFYLTGALLYQAKNIGGDLIDDESYRYNTNSSDYGGPLIVTSIDTPAKANLAPQVTGKSPISFLLGDGDNKFSFTSGSISNFAGLSLFFSDSDVNPNDHSYNPSDSLKRIGDLVVVVAIPTVPPSPTALPAQQVATTGALVQTYNAGGLAGIRGFNNAYNGAAFYAQDILQVAVTQYALAADGAGTFTLRVSPLTITAVPEPASLGLFGLVLCGTCKVLRRRKHRQT